MESNLILKCDSYKLSMPGQVTGDAGQWPPGTTSLYAYVESRGGKYGSTLFFGLQALLPTLAGLAFTEQDIEEFDRFALAHGEPSNASCWRDLLAAHGGALPIRIKAVPEGTIVPTRNVLCTIESTDSRFFWLVSWLETIILRAIWYPTTVATQSFYIKKTILQYLKETSNAPLAELPFKLHDFGARGVSSSESAGLGGMAHLVNFMGSDTIEGIRYADKYYGVSGGMAGFSIPASEHSTITSWGRSSEVNAYRNMLTRFAKPGKIVACVSDSYDLFKAIEMWCGDLREQIEGSGATLVIRPDSGNPAEIVLKTLQTIERKVGAPMNNVGFKQLPQWIRVIQGDGINHDSIEEILSTIKAHGFSASNIAFGMGGALLQQLNRDTQRFAYKTAEATVNGETVKVFKDPVTDSGKRSKAGRLSLVKRGGKLNTIEGSDANDDILQTVYENGQIKKKYTFDEVRANAERGLND